MPAKLRAVPIGTGLNLGTTTSRKSAAVPRRARIQGSQTFVSLNSRLESNREGGATWKALSPCLRCWYTCGLPELLRMKRAGQGASVVLEVSRNTSIATRQGLLEFSRPGFS